MFGIKAHIKWKYSRTGYCLYYSNVRTISSVAGVIAPFDTGQEDVCCFLIHGLDWYFAGPIAPAAFTITDDTKNAVILNVPNASIIREYLGELWWVVDGSFFSFTSSLNTVQFTLRYQEVYQRTIDQQ